MQTTPAAPAPVEAGPEVDPVLQRLFERFPDCYPSTFRAADGMPTAVVPREQIVEVCRFLRDEPDLKFEFLCELTCVDWPERPERFELVYILHSYQLVKRVRLKTYAGGVQPAVPSLTAVWPMANWYEREVYDLFGVVFEGHPDLRRILMPEDWEGHPLRRDFPLGEEPVDYGILRPAYNIHHDRGRAEKDRRLRGVTRPVV
ncbi:MAG: NADH-quinone oxidoreductase subunit C [Chloroflexota bacterium]